MPYESFVKFLKLLVEHGELEGSRNMHAGERTLMLMNSYITTLLVWYRPSSTLYSLAMMWEAVFLLTLQCFQLSWLILIFNAISVAVEDDAL